MWRRKEGNLEKHRKHSLWSGSSSPWTPSPIELSSIHKSFTKSAKTSKCLKNESHFQFFKFASFGGFWWAIIKIGKNQNVSDKKFARCFHIFPILFQTFIMLVKLCSVRENRPQAFAGPLQPKNLAKLLQNSCENIWVRSVDAHSYAIIWTLIN